MLLYFVPRWSKLPQEPCIVLKEHADIWNRVFQHRDSFNSKTKSESLPFILVVPDLIKHIGVYETTSTDFNPFPLAFDLHLHVNFGRGFGEREVTGAESKFRSLAKVCP